MMRSPVLRGFGWGDVSTRAAALVKGSLTLINNATQKYFGCGTFLQLQESLEARQLRP